MRRKLLALVGALAVGFGLQVPAWAQDVELAVGEPSVTTEVNPNKIDVLGIWAHPDDDAGFTTPCGVWTDRYDVKCGVVMLTRGEGGSNSVGDEAGPDLGLRRENEDRTSFYRSGVYDIYNIDAVDFWYNTSAALTEDVWGSERIQRQVVHVIRQTQPEILMGWAPSPAGHGHHQYSGRVNWEAVQMAADPNAFPEQLTGPDAVEPWQVKVVTSGAATNGTGGQLAAECNAGFVPADNNQFTVVGTWTGFESPYTWLEGNVQGMEPGTPMTWAQVGREGNRAHPTQARTKHTGVFEPFCQRYGIAQSLVPFQPNGTAANARDDAILFGTLVADPGGMPLGSTYTIDVGDYFQAPGVPFDVTVTAQSGEGTIAAGDVTLGLPEGWTITGDPQLGPISADAESSVTLTVTPSDDAALARYKIEARFSNGSVTAYNDSRVQLVAGVEGQFERWGNFASYEAWADEFTRVSGRSAAERQIGAGESVTIPVIVSNRTTVPQSGNVSVTVPAGFTVDEVTKPYTALAAGAQTTVDFVVTHTDPADPGGRIAEVQIVTTATALGSTSTETLRLYVVPTTVIPEAEVAPVVDGVADDFYGPALDIGRRWEGAACDPDGTDCGVGSTVRLAWHGDALYAQAFVVDNIASAAATPERCFGHWLVDSVEVLLDPLGGSRDTSTTFKTGIMPFTDDASGAAGQGPNGPCWSRDADNHQGFSSGPLATTVEGGPNSPGQEVAVDFDLNEDGTYVDGGFTVEVKIPLENLPAAVVTSTAPTGAQATNVVDPDYLGLNVTPYDSDVATFIGKTRTAWSPFGSQQSEPYRWGHAYLDGYAAPEGRSTTPDTPQIPDQALLGVESPQTIYQSAARGVTIAGLNASRALTVQDVSFDDDGATISVASAKAGTLRAFAWNGNPAAIPVWVSSCEGDEWGFSTCDLATDTAAAPWGDDMGGRLLGSVEKAISTGASTVRLALDAADLETLMGEDGTILISFQESATSAVNAWAYPVVLREVEPTKPPVTPPVTSPGKPDFVRTPPYTLPGYHDLNGRKWQTTCEAYSQTERCWTYIWATTIKVDDGKFVRTTGWAFNNLTYLPYMTRADWAKNPLGFTGAWTATDGRMWRTECDTAATGRGGCRSYAKVTVYQAHAKPTGGYTFTQSNEWVFNNIVLFKERV
ncbi:PIG-L family deacetylase [Tessaracoccus sp. Y36]